MAIDRDHSRLWDRAREGVEGLAAFAPAGLPGRSLTASTAYQDYSCKPFFQSRYPLAGSDVPRQGALHTV